MCIACDSTCFTCSGPNTNECDSCTGLRYILSNVCLTECGGTLWENTVTNTCDLCHTTC